MIPGFQHAPQGFGPGSQPIGEDLAYMPLPSGMRTFQQPYLELSDDADVAPALALLEEIASACHEMADRGIVASLPLSKTDQVSRRLISETLGTGEVSCIVGPVRAQESVFAGVWVLQAPDGDRIEVGPVPRDVPKLAFKPTAPALGMLAGMAEGVVNAPPLVTELMDRSCSFRQGQALHVINLSLLPHTEADLAFLERGLGIGSAKLLSRGYGNCRLTATALANVWRVQYFNSTDNLILDTIEVTDVPEVAMAAREDFEDSAQRLREVLEAVR